MTKLSVSIATFGIRHYRSLAEMEVHVSAFAAQAKAEGGSVLLLPEMANVGLLWTEPECANLAARAVGSAYERVLTPLFRLYQEAMSRIAARHDITLIGPSFWHKTDGVGTNSVLVCFPDGEIFRQDKIHLTRPEVAIDTVGGTKVGTFDIARIKAAALICYDIQFPELVRPLVDAGAQIIFVPSLTSKRGYWRVRYGSHARATENQIYVCVSPLFGNLGIPAERPLEAHGGAYVTCPIDDRLMVEDGLLVEAKFDKEGVLTIMLDFDLLELSRQKAEIRPLRDRRPSLYAQLQSSIRMDQD